MQPGRSRPRSGVRGGGLWGPLHPYAALATSAFAAGARFRAQAAAGRPRNASTAHSRPTLGVFEILGASAAPFACIGGVCLIVPVHALTHSLTQSPTHRLARSLARSKWQAHRDTRSTDTVARRQAHTHARTQARTHTRPHAHNTHTRTRTRTAVQGARIRRI